MNESVLVSSGGVGVAESDVVRPVDQVLVAVDDFKSSRINRNLPPLKNLFSTSTHRILKLSIQIILRYKEYIKTDLIGSIETKIKNISNQINNDDHSSNMATNNNSMMSLNDSMTSHDRSNGLDSTLTETVSIKILSEIRSILSNMIEFDRFIKAGLFIIGVELEDYMKLKVDAGDELFARVESIGVDAHQISILKLVYSSLCKSTQQSIIDLIDMICLNIEKVLFFEFESVSTQTKSISQLYRFISNSMPTRPMKYIQDVIFKPIKYIINMESKSGSPTSSTSSIDEIIKSKLSSSCIKALNSALQSIRVSGELILIQSQKTQAFLDRKKNATLKSTTNTNLSKDGNNQQQDQQQVQQQSQQQSHHHQYESSSHYDIHRLANHLLPANHEHDDSSSETLLRTNKSPHQFSDFEKIRIQIYLDVIEIAKQLNDIGIDAMTLDSFVELWQLVKEAPQSL